MAAQGRKRGAVLLETQRAALPGRNPAFIRLAVSELPAPDQPRQGSPHREAYGER